MLKINVSFNFCNCNVIFVQLLRANFRGRLLTLSKLSDTQQTIRCSLFLQLSRESMRLITSQITSMLSGSKKRILRKSSKDNSLVFSRTVLTSPSQSGRKLLFILWRQTTTKSLHNNSSHKLVKHKSVLFLNMRCSRMQLLNRLQIASAKRHLCLSRYSLI